jgi:predicted dehydrogenase
MDDNTVLLLDFGDNCFGVVGGQFCFPGQILSWGFMGIFGSQGAVEIPKLAPGTGYPSQVQPNPPILAQVLPNVLSNPPLPASITEAHAVIPESHVWADVCHLVDCIQSDGEPVANGAHARHVIEIIEKGYAAARSGQTLALESDLARAKSQASI